MQGRIGEDFLQMAVFRGVFAVQDAAFGNAAHHGLFHRAVRLESDQQGVVIAGAVALFHDFVVVSLHGDHAGVHHALFQHPLQGGTLEGAEDVARPKVDPAGGFAGGGDHGLPVEGGQDIALFQPFGTVGKAFFRQYKHLISLLFQWLPTVR